MNNDLIALTRNEDFIILNSVGIKVYILNTLEELNEKIKKIANTDVKIIFYDYEGSEIVNEIIEKYDELPYPIFVKLPSSKNEQTLENLQELIAKSIGISVI